MNQDKAYSLLAWDGKSRQKKDTRTRLNTFIDWLKDHDLAWYEPDFKEFSKHLEKEGLVQSSIQAYVSTIRNHYQRLIQDGTARKQLETENVTPVSEILHNLSREVKSIQIQTHLGGQRSITYRVITKTELENLLLLPDTKKRQGVRDVAVLGLMICAGLRETEIAALDVEDLDLEKSRVTIPEVTGGQRREVPFGDAIIFGEPWLAHVIYVHLTITGLEKEAFRGFYRGGQTMRPNRITFRGVQNLVRQYSPEDETAYTPLDLRRAYARQLYRHDVSIDAIQAYLGTTDYTAREYVGRFVEARYKLKGQSWYEKGESASHIPKILRQRMQFWA